MTLRPQSLAALSRRLDAQALEQLRTVAAAQAKEIDDLRVRLADTEETLDFWWRSATDMQLELCERTGAQPGITQSGRLVVVPTGAAA